MRPEKRIIVLAWLLGWLMAWTPPVAVAAPSLTVEQRGGVVVVRWPVAAGYYVLEETAALTEPILWAQSLATPVQQGSDWIAAISPSERSRFFRLRQALVAATFQIKRHVPLDGATEVGVTYRRRFFSPSRSTPPR